MTDHQASQEITQLLRALRTGGEHERAVELLYAKVYQQLRRLAKAHVRGERSDVSLQATELIHEAFLRLVDERERDWQGRGHFFAVAARAMRRILVDRARARRALKRGGMDPVKLEASGLEQVASTDRSADEVVAIDQILDQFTELFPRPGQVVEMRFYGGYTESEIAELLGVSDRTVKRDWDFARSWLRNHLQGGDRSQAKANNTGT